MSKSTRVPADFDWASSEREIVAEISSHVPNKAGCPDSPRLLAKEIIRFWRNPILAPSKHFAKTTEQRKLKTLRQAARSLKAAYDDLDPEIKFALRTSASPSGGFAGLNGRTSSSESDLLRFLYFGPELLDRLTPKIELQIEGAKTAGRQNFAEIRLVHQCAHVWEWRTGTRPKSERHRQFSLFVTGVFHAIGIDTDAVSPTNTIRSWRRCSG